MQSALSNNEKQQEKANKLKGFITSAIVHALLILLLWFFGLPYLDPPPPDAGILVNFGTTETGLGNEPSEVLEETQEVTAEESNPDASSQPETQEEVITQEEEITAPVVKKEEPKKEVTKETIIKKETKTEPTKDQPVKETPKVNQRALFTGKKSDNNNPNNQGINKGNGDQGKPWGDPTSNNYGDGKGKGDSGIGYSLGGRKHVALPRPDENSQTTGIIVIRVKVDRKGNVTEASYQSKGSTSTNAGLINAAVLAAKKAKFEADANALEFQLGSITYNFKVQ
jgi:periplasmic protein TonB